MKITPAIPTNPVKKDSQNNEKSKEKRNAFIEAFRKAEKERKDATRN